MLEVIQEKDFDSDLYFIFKLSDKDKLFSIKDKEEYVGYGIIRDDDFNKISVFISKSFQGKGYGNVLFKELLNKVENKNFEVKVEIDNYMMQRIVVKNNGKEISRNGKDIIYKFFEEN